MLLGVNETNPSTRPIDEDRVDLPDEWRKYTLDRRGRGTPRPVETDPEAPQRSKALFTDHAEKLAIALSGLKDRAFESAIRDWLAGKPDPLGAALTAAILSRLTRVARPSIEAIARDAWIAQHGTAFATQAAVEMIGHSVSSRIRVYEQFGQTEIWEPSVPDLATVYSYLDFIAPLRSLLAALPESEYAEARASVEALRTTDAKKFAAALLMPDQEAWVREACDLHHGSTYAFCDLLWAMVSSSDHLERSGAWRIGEYHDEARRTALVVDGLGVDALPVLVNSLEHEDRPSLDMRRLLFDAISRLPSDAAVAYLLGNLTLPLAGAAAASAARRFPARALRAVASCAPNADAAAAARLAGFVRANGLMTKIDALNDTDREHIETMLQRRHQVADTLPQVFTEVPWAPYAKPATKRAAIELAPPAIDELRWAPDERQAWTTNAPTWEYWANTANWQRWWPGADDPKHHVFNELVAYGPEERARAAFAKWDGTSASLNTSTLQVILARYGQEAVPHAMAVLKRKSSHRDALLPLLNRDAARLAAGWLSRSRNERAFAKTWLDRHAADAAAFLIPDAVGKDAKPAKSAMDALRYLERSIVDEQAAAYGEAAADAVAALLDADPLDPQLPRIPKPGAWADPGMLPQILLAGRGAALPDAAVRTLMTALAMDDGDRPYAGVDLLAAECDRVSLAAFSWGLFELWLSAGSPSKDAWAMDQLRRFADDGAVRRLTALIREWPGQSQNRKAIRGLEILGGVGSEAALRAVDSLSRKAKFKALKQTAVEQIEVIAERLGLSLDQLGDRLVPDFGLRDASPVLDYGPRSFTIKFDEALKPFVMDDKGKRRASAPKPGAKDDPELAQPAYERFIALRKDLKATAAEQVKRLEAAMTAGRTWTRAEFQEFLIDHPLMWHLSSRLVWQADGASFRIAEDRTLADAEDEPFELAEEAAVRLAHPLTLGDEIEAWAGVFADYEILQPFDQLARPVFVPTEEESTTGRLTRFEGGKTGGGVLIGLLTRGWKFGGPEARAGGYGLYRDLPEGGCLYLESEPGVHPGYGYGYENEVEQTLSTVEIIVPEGKTLDPVVVSEAMHAVSRLLRSAR
jgi:hypothetical protein